MYKITECSNLTKLALLNTYRIELTDIQVLVTNKNDYRRPKSSLHVLNGANAQFREQFLAPDRRFKYTVGTKYLFGNEPTGVQ